MVKAVPPGGNWKDIPVTIPSQRLRQIRESYAKGGGSRSTYYGRLHPDRPSYTINTCFNRPGNGCFIHYNMRDSQHRLISQREAARLQSFPDSVEFFGSKASINKQIGNAVPPLLAFQIASSFGEPGRFVDLFCGAGGLSLGFVWANWRPVLGADLEPSFLQTYSAAIDSNVVCGDITRTSVFQEIIDRSRRLTSHTSDRFFVLGGPPCQGFSTAGNRRSMSDGRNLLYVEYCRSLKLLQPDGFLFENVLGLTNMEGGRVLATIVRMLEDLDYNVSVWRLKAEDFGIPQRRQRIFVVGARGSVTMRRPPACDNVQCSSEHGPPSASRSHSQGGSR